MTPQRRSTGIGGSTKRPKILVGLVAALALTTIIILASDSSVEESVARTTSLAITTESPSTTATSSSGSATSEIVEPAEDLVFSRRLPWTLVFDSGLSHISVLDLNHDQPSIVEIEGARGGDQPYRLTLHEGHLVVGWREIYAFDTTTLESSLLSEATIHIPASTPSRVWMVNYPGGRTGSGPLEVWQVHVAGGQTSARQILDVDGHPAHGIPGGIAFEGDSGVVLWNAEGGNAVGSLGTETGFVSDATADGKLAWCEGSCDEMNITDLNDGTEIAVSHPTGGSFDARGARFTDDGRYLAAPTAMGVVLADTITGDSQIVITFPPEVDSSPLVSWAPDSHVLFAASYGYGESETVVGYWDGRRQSLGADLMTGETAEMSTLPHGGTLSFVVLRTTEAGRLLGTEPEAEPEPAPSPDCPVTIPERLFTPPVPFPPDPVHAGLIWYGNDDLWTILEVDGMIGYRKSIWWSARFLGGGEEPEPEIAVTWEKLDDPNHQVIADQAPGTNAHTPEDGDFMIAGIDPEIAGCWRVTATYKGARLSYIYETR